MGTEIAGRLRALECRQESAKTRVSRQIAKSVQGTIGEQVQAEFSLL
mgnify:CR=1